MSSEQLERGLQASVKIFEFSKGKLAQLGEGETECRLSRDELVSMKKAAAAMNRALTALVRESHEAAPAPDLVRLLADTGMLSILAGTD